MKYIVILGDGMADYKIKELGNKTPLEVANKPTIDNMAKVSEVGMCKTVPDGFKPGSDVANLSVLGYDAHTCYTGRSPLEAVSIGITLNDTDVTYRCNLVTVSDEKNYEDKTMIDYSSGEITTEESNELIAYLKQYLDNDIFTLYPGVSYRHCLLVKNGVVGNDLTPPHDISLKPVKEHLPKGEYSQIFLDMMKKSYELLKNHPINLKRIKEGKNPANSVWFWGEGTKPALDNFKEKFKVKGAVISAVDLVKGIGILAGMKSIDVDGATGNYTTNFLGKAKACVDALLKDNFDLVYIHMEAPDECGHQGDAIHKIYSIEQISEVVVKYVKEKLNEHNEPFRMLICPDHPTPVAIRTHISDPIPYMIYDSENKILTCAEKYDEDNGKKTGIFIENGFELMKKLINK